MGTAELVLYNIASYLIEYMKLMPLAFMFFGISYISHKRLITVSLISVAATAVTAIFINVVDSDFGSIGIMLISALFILKKKHHIFYLLIIYIYICILDLAFNSVTFFFLDLNPTDYTGDATHWSTLPLNCISILFIFMAIFIKYKRRKSLSYKFSKSYILLFAAVGITLAVYLASLNFFAFSENDLKSVKIATIAIGLSVFIILIVISLLAVNKSQNENLKKENAATNKILQMKEEYYLMLLKNEEQTKAFRHDLRSHLNCLQTLYNEKKFDEFEAYFGNLTDEFKELKGGTDTGNDLVNAIINDISGRYDDVNLSWKGHIPQKLSVSSFELCTIFSNIMNNAFEAAAKTEQKKVDASVGIMDSNMIITVNNSTASEPVTDGKRFITSKNEVGHGYGVRNVQECTKKMGGVFELTCNDGVVTVRIVLLNVIPNVSE